METKYAGLRIEDKAALLEAKAEGNVWVVFYRDKTMKFWKEVPYLGGTYSVYCMEIDAALLQIAEMEAEKKLSGCDFCNGKSDEHGFFVDENVLYYRNGQLGTEGIVINTCPMCARRLSPAEDGK